MKDGGKKVHVHFPASELGEHKRQEIHTDQPALGHKKMGTTDYPGAQDADKPIERSPVLEPRGGSKKLYGTVGEKAKHHYPGVQLADNAEDGSCSLHNHTKYHDGHSALGDHHGKMLIGKVEK